MEWTVDELPGWLFDTREVAYGIYTVKGKHRLGYSLDLTGPNHDHLVERAKGDARRMDAEVLTRLQSKKT